jgi:hypothetical protein
MMNPRVVDAARIRRALAGAASPPRRDLPGQRGRACSAAARGPTRALGARWRSSLTAASSSASVGATRSDGHLGGSARVAGSGTGSEGADLAYGEDREDGDRCRVKASHSAALIPMAAATEPRGRGLRPRNDPARGAGRARARGRLISATGGGGHARGLRGLRPPGRRANRRSPTTTATATRRPPTTAAPPRQQPYVTFVLTGRFSQHSTSSSRLLAAGQLHRDCLRRPVAHEHAHVGDGGAGAQLRGARVARACGWRSFWAACRRRPGA